MMQILALAALVIAAFPSAPALVRETMSFAVQLSILLAIVYYAEKGLSKNPETTKNFDYLCRDVKMIKEKNSTIEVRLMNAFPRLDELIRQIEGAYYEWIVERSRDFILRVACEQFAVYIEACKRSGGTQHVNIAYWQYLSAPP